MIAKSQLPRRLKLVAFVLLLQGLRIVDAQDQSRDAMKGLKGVYVVVEPIPKPAEQSGLTSSQLQTDVELLLREAGIHIFTKAEWKSAPGCPGLDISLELIPNKNTPGQWIYHADVALMEDVRLVRDPNIGVTTEIWASTNVLGSIGAERVSDLRSEVAELVKQFANAYLAANPK